jgi:hypothetical protein
VADEYRPTINLEQYIQNEIRHERELRVEAALHSQIALDKQAREYERRLDDLNNSHERLNEIQARSVSRDTFDGYVTSQAAASERMREADLTWKRDINKAIDEARGANNRQIYLIALFLSLLTIVLRFVPVA